MTHGEQELAAGPKWLPWAFLGLLVLPFHPLWIDFEQVRRGLLLALAGAALCALPRLPSPPGNGAGTLFIGALVLSGVWTWCAQQSEQDADAPASFAAWEATYRIAHWYALLVTMRLGALSGAASATAPAATLLLATSAFGLLQHLGVAEVAGYGVAREPVTTLGNLNVAAEWTAVATAATVALLPLCTRRGRWLAGIALVFAGAYLMVNPSRSGKVAAACALAALALVHLRDRRKLKVAACGALALAVGEPCAPARRAKHRMERAAEHGDPTSPVRDRGQRRRLAPRSPTPRTRPRHVSGRIPEASQPGRNRDL